MKVERMAPTREAFRTHEEFRIAELEARVDQLEAEKRELEVLARIDALTGLGNRRAFEDALDTTTRYAARYSDRVSLVLIDLDGMKALNDGHGHPIGDQGLHAVGQVLQKTLRATDIACRCGGDEFAVLLPGTGRRGAMHVAEKLRQAICQVTLHVADLHLRPFSASIGVAAFVGPPSAVAEGTQLIKLADDALYRAKRSGKNCVVDGTLDVVQTKAA